MYCKFSVPLMTKNVLNKKLKDKFVGKINWTCGRSKVFLATKAKIKIGFVKKLKKKKSSTVGSERQLGRHPKFRRKESEDRKDLSLLSV